VTVGIGPAATMQFWLLSAGGREVAAAVRRSRLALLAYLATHQAHFTGREVVAKLLWPERPPGAAGSKPPPHAEHPAPFSSPQVTVDVQALNRLAQMSESQAAHLATAETALELYRGPFSSSTFDSPFPCIPKSR
jgi:hypothetical protein